MNNDNQDGMRVKLVYVNQSDVMHNLNFGETFFPCERASLLKPINLPEGFKVIAVTTDFSRSGFVFLVSHPSFEIVPSHIVPPEIRAEMVTVKPDLVLLLEKQRQLCQMIEQLPASANATEMSVLASDVAAELQSYLYPTNEP